MEEKHSRSNLKDHFKAGQIPEEAHFADMIDASLNQQDDGIRNEEGNIVVDNALTVGGNVGIGTSSPASKLHVANGDLRLDVNRELLFEDNGQIRSFDNNHCILFRRAENKMEFRERGDIIFSSGSTGAETNAMVIKSDGKVGIGTSTPAVALTVNGDISLGIEKPGDKDNKTGNKLFFLGASTSSDPIWMARHNISNDKSELRINLGDNTGGSAIDSLVIGASSGNWTPKHIFRSDGDAEIGRNATINNVFIGDVGHGSNWAGFSHKNAKGTNSYGIAHSADGKKTLINALSGGTGIAFRISNSTKMLVSSNGNVGIATTNPIKGKLEIGTYASYDFAPKGGIGPNGKLMGAQQNGNWGTALWAEGKLAAHGFFVPSDNRIKKIIGISDAQKDLETINAIEITNFKFTDTIGRGAKAVKKIIAQQVQEVFPQAVSLSTDEVPDIYQAAKIEKGWVNLATDLKVGEKVQLIFDSDKQLLEVLETKKDAFRVATTQEGEVFVFGRQVHDFHTVDYDAIAMLNVSATQALATQMEQLLAVVQAQAKKIAALEKKIESLVR